MLHLLYILAFTIIAFLTISNLIRSLITVSLDSQKRSNRPINSRTDAYGYPVATHPELLDESGRPINEPLLVMRSVTVEDARQQLDAIYKASPGQPREQDEEV